MDKYFVTLCTLLVCMSTKYGRVETGIWNGVDGAAKKEEEEAEQKNNKRQRQQTPMWKSKSSTKALMKTEE